MTPDMSATPKLAKGVRLSDKNQQPRTLLMPERALRLNGPSLAIACGGQLFLELRLLVGCHHSTVRRQIFYRWITACFRRHRHLSPRVHR